MAEAAATSSTPATATTTTTTTTTTTATPQTTQATAIPHKKLDLTITVLAGQAIPLPPGDTTARSFHPYVKVEVHVEDPEERIHGSGHPGSGHPSGHPGSGHGGSGHGDSGSKPDAAVLAETEGRAKEGEYRARTHPSHGRDPEFGGSGSSTSGNGETLAFAGVPGVVEELAFVRFIVKDSEVMKRDDLAAWASVRLDRLRPGYRFVHLLDARGQTTEGVLLVRVSKRLY